MLIPLLFLHSFYITFGVGELFEAETGKYETTTALHSDRISQVPCGRDSCEDKSNTKYFLYDVNPGEGFNLRRDVWIRIAPLIKTLNEIDLVNKWILVLPPWGRLPHWHNQDKFFQWSTYFRLDKIRNYIPAIELDEYLEEYGFDNDIDIVLQLQHFPFDPDDRAWNEKRELGVSCEHHFPYKWNFTERRFSGPFWNQKMFSKNGTCMALRGQASSLTKFLIESGYKSVMFDRAEVILWDTYGGPEWWKARASLQFSHKLTQRAAAFLTSHIPSFQPRDPARSNSYVGVHLRRQDFLFGRRSSLPSLQGTVIQLIKLSKRLKLPVIFLASDASVEEFAEFSMELKLLSEDQDLTLQLLSFRAGPETSDLSEGEIAVIDQIICSWSTFFIGTPDSTFTLRIFEEREILGFESDLTFNHLCPDQNDEEEPECKQPTKWKYPRSK